MLSTINNATLERLERKWVTWETYMSVEGKDVAEKQKLMGLVVDS